jgi:Replication protein
MPPDEVSPDQRVRAYSSRRQTTDDNQYKDSNHRTLETSALSLDARKLPRRRLRFRDLLDLRTFGKALTDDERLRGCGYELPSDNIGDADDEIRRTTRCCDKSWLCGVCGYHTARNQSLKLAKILRRWTSQGGSVVLLTLTQSHRSEDELEKLWARAEAGWSALVRGSGWRGDRKSFGIRGYIRITEIVHQSDNGWHVHFHVPLLLADKQDDQQLDALKDRLTARFMSGVRAAGGRASGNGQDLIPMRHGTERHVASYYAKGTKALWSSNSRTPMAILADLKETGEGIGLWMEFVAAVTRTRRRRYCPSWGIANLARLLPRGGEADAIP